LGPTQLSAQCVPGSLLGVKRPGLEVDCSSPSNGEV